MKHIHLKWIFISLISAYIISGILLLFTAFLLYRLEPDQSMVSIGIVVIYVLSTFLGGTIAGKGIGSRKYLWGVITGCLYFLILMITTAIVGKGTIPSGVQIMTVMALCLGGGMLGGMLA